MARKEDGKRAGIPPVRAVAVPPRGRQRHQADVRQTISTTRRRPVASRDGRFIYFAARPRNFNYEPESQRRPLADRRYDRTTGERFADRRRLRRRGAARAFARRQDAGLRQPARRRHRARRARRSRRARERMLARGVTRDEHGRLRGRWTSGPTTPSRPTASALVFCSDGKLQRLDARPPARRRRRSRSRPRSSSSRCADGDLAGEDGRRAREGEDPALAQPVAGRPLDRVRGVRPRAGCRRSQDGKPAGAPRRLTATSRGPEREYAPAFSPDGQCVAYVTWSDAEGGQCGSARRRRRASRRGRACHDGRPATTPIPSWSPIGRPDRADPRAPGWSSAAGSPRTSSSSRLRWLERRRRRATVRHHASSWRRRCASIRRCSGAPTARASTTAAPVELKKPTDDPKTDLVSIRLDGTDGSRCCGFRRSTTWCRRRTGSWLAVLVARRRVRHGAAPGRVLTPTAGSLGLKEASMPVWRLTDDAGGYAPGPTAARRSPGRSAPTFHRLTLADAIAFATRRGRRRPRQGEEGKRARGRAGREGRARKTSRAGRRPRSRASRQSESFHDRSISHAAPRRRAVSLALTGARVVTMKGDEILAERRHRHHRQPHHGDRPVGQRDHSVRRDAHWTAPARPLSPGLIDTHAHLHYSGVRGLPETKWEYAANLAYGVTTVYDPSAPSLDVFAQAEMVEAGRMLGPRVYSSGDVLYGGQQAPIYAEVDSQDDARRQVRRMKAYGARMIKVYQQPRRDQRLWFAQACREEHMLLTAEGAGELQTDLTTVIGRLHGVRARAARTSCTTIVIQLLARVAHVLHADAHRRLRRAPRPSTTSIRQRNPHDDEKLRRFVPHPMLDQLGAAAHVDRRSTSIHFPTVAEGAAAAVRARGRQRLARRARAAPGPRRALGAVGAWRGRAARRQDGHDAVRGAEGIDARGRGEDRLPSRPRHASRPASSPTSSSSTRIRSPTSTTA